MYCRAFDLMFFSTFSVTEALFESGHGSNETCSRARTANNLEDGNF